MPALARAFSECAMKRCRYLKLSAYIMCLCSGLVVAILGNASLTRLNVLSVESQRWGLHGHQRHLAALAVATVVLGSACALAAVLGCVDALLARRPHLALDVVTGVLILAQVGVASAGFTLMIWLLNGMVHGGVGQPPDTPTNSLSELSSESREVEASPLDSAAEEEPATPIATAAKKKKAGSSHKTTIDFVRRTTPTELFTRAPQN
ncbi:uncharacterized protein LOC142578370 [Dermacentor variabilis]|uniref:uncharacterized protein LOC142578370 n=1 Tax=Dermacentor variabilis TaxID=34621 RepID=UPI003F5AECF8